MELGREAVEVEVEELWRAGWLGGTQIGIFSSKKRLRAHFHPKTFSSQSLSVFFWVEKGEAKKRGEGGKSQYVSKIAHAKGKGQEMTRCVFLMTVHGCGPYSARTVCVCTVHAKCTVQQLNVKLVLFDTLIV